MDHAEQVEMWRGRAHKAFDPIWRSGITDRAEAYRWLADKLRCSEPEAHIANLGIQSCQQVVEIMREAKRRGLGVDVELWRCRMRIESCPQPNPPTGGPHG